MKVGSVINGYEVTTKPTNSGGGRCMWAFATHGRKEFFIKKFLDPRWPLDTSPGSAADKELRRQECRTFEARHRQIARMVNPTEIGGGNLVCTVAFFREGTSYYKITEKIEAVAAADLTEMTLRQRAVMLRTLCHSIKLLHRAGIVHGDLKPGNVLLQRSGEGDLVVAKLIDFDDAYRSGEPPPRDDLVGDQPYGSPEWLSYVKGDPAVGAKDLTTATDIFALGLILHVYLTGALPGIAGHASSGDALLAGAVPMLSSTLHPRTAHLIRQMTAVKAGERPAIDAILTHLANEDMLALTSTRIRKNFEAPPPLPPEDPPPPGVSRVRKRFDP